APRFTARATETGFPRQRTRFPADQATELTLFCDKARDLLDVADRNLLVLETEPQNDVALDSVRRAIHAMSRFACYLGLADLGRFGRAFCGCLAAVAQGRFSLEGPRLDVAFDSIEVLRHHLGYVEEALNNKSPMRREKQLREYIAVLSALSAGNCESLRIGAVIPYPQGQKLGDILVSSGFITRETLEAGRAAQAEAPETPRLGEILVGQARVSRDQIEASLTAQQENPSLGKLGHILAQWGLVDPKAIETALAEQRARGRPRLGEVFMQMGAASAKAIAQALRRQRLGQAGAAAALVAASFMAPAIPAGSSIVEQPGDTDVVWIMEEGQSLHTEREELREAVKAALAASPTLPETDSDGMLDSWQSRAVPHPPGGAETGEDEGSTEEFAPDFDETEYWNAPQVPHDAGAPAAVSGTPSPTGADMNAEPSVSAADIQCMINAALGLDTPVPANLGRTGALGALDIQSILKKVLGIQAG
ncbi:MAG: hypothetical protein R6V12_11630, partial [Candidatus Hydrogenedentota bacterium]